MRFVRNFIKIINYFLLIIKMLNKLDFKFQA